MSSLGSGAEIFDINPQSSSTTAQHQLGTTGYDRVGRMYRYVKNGAVLLVTGNLLQSAARDTNYTDLVVVSGAAGQKEIVATLGGTAVTANQFDGGTLAVSITPGLGQTFTIKSHTVQTSTTGNVTFTVEEDIVVALTTASNVTVNKNLYDGVIQSPTTRTGKTVGVATFAIPAGTAAIPVYGWIGTRGVFAVLSDATVAAVGEGLSPSTSTAGCVTKQVTLLENVGTAGVLGVSAQCEPAFITIN